MSTRRLRVATRVLCSAVALFALGMLALPAVSAAKPGKPKPKPKPKPDLVVKDLQFVAPPGISQEIPHIVVENDGSAAFGLFYVVKNTGKARAAGSTLEVKLNNGKFASVHVKPLKPGKRAAINTPFNRRFSGPGFYDAKVCADGPDKISETSETNNCKGSIPIRAVPRSWTTLSFDLKTTSSPGPQWFTDGSGVRWNYGGVTDRVADDGSVTKSFYWLGSGGVTETFSGQTDDCTYSGSGTASHPLWFLDSEPRGALSIAGDLKSYSATIEDNSVIYAASADCTGDDPPDGFDSIDVLQTWSPGGGFNPPSVPGAKELAGSFSSSFSGTTHFYRWFFLADIP